MLRTPSDVSHSGLLSLAQIRQTNRAVGHPGGWGTANGQPKTGRRGCPVGDGGAERVAQQRNARMAPPLYSTMHKVQATCTSVYLQPVGRCGPNGVRCAVVAELDEGERNGIEEEHCAYDAADGPSQKPQCLSFIIGGTPLGSPEGSANARTCTSVPLNVSVGQAVHLMRSDVVSGV
jgi:hypothetical protein